MNLNTINIGFDDRAEQIRFENRAHRIGLGGLWEHEHRDEDYWSEWDISACTPEDIVELCREDDYIPEDDIDNDWLDEIDTDTVTVRGETYRCRLINLGDMEVYIGPESLEGALCPDGVPVGQYEEEIDDRFYAYIPDEIVERGSDKEVAEYVAQNIN